MAGHFGQSSTPAKACVTVFDHNACMLPSHLRPDSADVAVWLEAIATSGLHSASVAELYRQNPPHFYLTFAEGLPHLNVKHGATVV